jgi:hypothetical protein
MNIQTYLARYLKRFTKRTYRAQDYQQHIPEHVNKTWSAAVETADILQVIKRRNLGTSLKTHSQLKVSGGTSA